MTPRFEFREEYLQALVARLRPDFGAIGIELPPVRCSCSFAYRGGRHVVGQCFPGSMSADGVPQIKIIPTLDDPVAVAAVLVHELVHACRPGAGHGKNFRDIAIPMGLLPPMRSTTAGPELTERLIDITEELGSYPHAAIDLDAGRRVRIKVGRPGDGPGIDDEPPKQTGRLIKVACPDCGYLARVTRMWLAQAGPPICPCGPRMQIDQSHPLLRGGDQT